MFERVLNNTNSYFDEPYFPSPTINTSPKYIDLMQNRSSLFNNTLPINYIALVSYLKQEPRSTRVSVKCECKARNICKHLFLISLSCKADLLTYRSSICILINCGSHETYLQAVFHTDRLINWLKPNWFIRHSCTKTN